jgi:Family of unknown function (DUF6328)
MPVCPAGVKIQSPYNFNLPLHFAHQERNSTVNSLKSADLAGREADLLSKISLGFQLAIVLTTGFADLPATLRSIHAVAIGLIVLATVLLMAPAAYHRIVYDGADAPEFHMIASRFLLAATVFLALGLSAEIRVVVSKITTSNTLATTLAVVSVALLLGLWHLWPWWVRRARIISSPVR